MGYYAQSISGHLDLVGRAKPVPQWLEAADTPEALKERLRLSQRMRDFAVDTLHLPNNDSYRLYADLQRPSAVWNVVAAPPLSLKLQTWCFPVMGCVGYRGYFHQADAEAYAEQLRQQGLEVLVYGVTAYSTLGRLPGGLSSDPLLNTFIRFPEGELARMIFHELAHQVAYANNDTVFNESFATAVERLGGEQWLQQHASPAARAEYQRANERREAFRALTGRYRDRLQALYQGPGSDEEKRAGKAALMGDLRSDHEQLKRNAWGGYAGYDHWFERANNASFGVLSAYNALVPQFERLFERQGRDFKRFYAEVQRLAALPGAERHAALAAAVAVASKPELAH
ncbi:MAG: aminopeptidase [Pseudomonadota bacterium]